MGHHCSPDMTKSHAVTQIKTKYPYGTLYDKKQDRWDSLPMQPMSPEVNQIKTQKETEINETWLLKWQ